MVKTALEEFAFLIPLLPALAFVITFFFGRKMPSGGAIVPILAIAASFVISFVITLGLLANPEEVVSQSYSWFAVLNIGVLIRSSGCSYAVNGLLCEPANPHLRSQLHVP